MIWVSGLIRFPFPKVAKGSPMIAYGYGAFWSYYGVLGN